MERKQNMKKLTLKNSFFWAEPGMESLGVFLSKLQLHGKESRARSRFLLLIQPRMSEIEAERTKILEANAKRNKQGEILFISKDGKETTKRDDSFEYSVENKEKVLKEVNDYLAEDYVLDVTPETSETIYGVRDILNNTQEQFSGELASRYFAWTEAFDNIKEEK